MTTTLNDKTPITDLSDDDFATLQTNFNNGVLGENKKDFLNKLNKEVNNPIRFQKMITSLTTGDKELFVESMSLPEGEVKSIVNTPEDQQQDAIDKSIGVEPDGVMESAEASMTPVEAATVEGVAELQQLPPDQAIEVIDKLSTQSDNPANFSRGLITLYNAKNLDFSEFAFATQCYFSELKAKNKNKYDFSCNSSTTKRLITEYNTLDVPTAFSIFEGAARVVNHLCNFSEDTSMINEAVDEADTTTSDDEAEAQMDVPATDQPEDMMDVYNDLVAKYNSLASEDAKKAFIANLAQYIGAQSAQEFSEMAEDDAETIKRLQEVQEKFKDDEQMNQIIEAFRQTPNEQKEAFLEQLQKQYGIEDDVKSYIIAKADGVVFSEHEDANAGADIDANAGADIDAGADINVGAGVDTEDDEVIPDIEPSDGDSYRETEIASVSDDVPYARNGIDGTEENETTDDNSLSLDTELPVSKDPITGQPVVKIQEAFSLT